MFLRRANVHVRYPLDSHGAGGRRCDPEESNMMRIDRRVIEPAVSEWAGSYDGSLVGVHPVLDEIIDDLDVSLLMVEAQIGLG
jgi:hypothetical protein